MLEKPKLLIVDDDPSSLVTLCNLLNRLHCDVIEVMSAEEVLNYCVSQDVALVLLNPGSVGINAYELMRLLKLSPVTQDIPVILIAAASLEGQLLGYQAGAIDYIQKPLNELILQTKIRFYLDLFQHRHPSQHQQTSGETLRIRTADNEARLRQALMDAPIAIMLHADDGEIVLFNRVWTESTGYSLDDMSTIDDWLQKACGITHHQTSRCRVDQQLFITEPAFFGEHRLYTASGYEITWNFRSSLLAPLADGRQLIMTVAADMTESKIAEATLLRLNRALNLLSKCNSLLIHAENEQELLANICRLSVETGGYLMAWVGFGEHDAEKTVRPVAQSGYEEGYLESINITWADTERGRGPTGTAIRAGLTEVNQNCLTNPKMVPWRAAALERGYQSSIALPLICNQNTLGAITIYSAEPSSFSPEEVSLLEELANDLAYGIQALRIRLEHAEAEKKLAFLAHHDPLTSLPNRLLLRERFEQAADFANKNQSTVAILFLDMDNFKQINDGLGHGYGDQLLIQVASRLRGCLLESDTICRQGGDEFIVLLTNIHDEETVGVIIASIVEAFVEPVSVDDYVLNTSFSVGVSLYPRDGVVFDDLLKKADMALYQAKDAGRNTYRFFTQQMNSDALAHMRLEAQLRNAIKQQELLLHYQPQIEIQTGRIIGAEALVRWRHPELGLISPGVFIPLAERCGLIVPLGDWVLQEACRQAQQWRELYPQWPLVVAVNLSALQFKRGNIVETVNQALSRTGLSANLLELELTESILLQDVELVIKTLHSLKELGVKLSIDDFGTGYSSLSYLKRLAVDKLKIDQSFVREMVEEVDDAEIVRAIIQLGQILRLTTIAEGVENEAQLALLNRYGCAEAQGYLISRPLPAAEFAVFYEQCSEGCVNDSWLSP